MAANKFNLTANQYLAAVAGATLVVTLVSVLIGRGLVHNLTFNNRVITKKTAARNQLQANLVAIPELEKNFTALQGQNNLILRALPSQPDFTGLASMIESMAGQTGLRLKDVSQAGTPETPTGGASPLQFTVQGNGSYDSLLRFLVAIQTAARPMRVNSLNLSGSTPSLSMNLTLTTYYQGAYDISPKTEAVK